jgi:hypothetical protein
MPKKKSKVHEALDQAKAAGELAKIVCPKCGHPADKAIKAAQAVDTGLSIFAQFKDLFSKK